MKGRRHPPSSGVVVILLALGAAMDGVLSSLEGEAFLFLPSSLPVQQRWTTSATRLGMAKSKTKSLSSTAGLKGFGGTSFSNPVGGGGVKRRTTTGIVDRTPSALNFYDYLVRNGGESNLARVGLGHFPLRVGPTDADIVQLRGIVALRDIPKGESIIEIPYEMALDLGRENADPTLPATTFLQKYCAWKTNSVVVPGDRERGDYFSMIPPYFTDSDCMGSTDFYSDVALEMMQSPTIVDETTRRREMVSKRYDRDVVPMATMSSNLYRWEDNDGDRVVASKEHLQWATWVITSRVLTVQGSNESPTARRLLIPLIDMCNHDRNSPHILTGRAVSGAFLKVVAGCDVRAGDAVNIAYGGGVEGNDRFIQDYGFLDAGGSKEKRSIGLTQEGDSGAFVAVIAAEGYRIVARRILGKGRPGTLLSRMTASESSRELNALSESTLEHDEALLMSGTLVANDERMALEYRIGVKRALRMLKEQEQ